MKKEELYREIGLIDDQLIEAAEYGEKEKVRRTISKKWIALIACLMLYSSTATVLLATGGYYKNQNDELYIRYLTAENMELESAAEYDADKFLQALKSDDEMSIYIAINRLVESFNDKRMKDKALQEIKPFTEDDNAKIADAAAFAVDILSQSYQSPYVYKLADGSILFTLFNNYSDYGSQNVIWKIKGNVLEQYTSFSGPSMYIKEIIPSPDQKLIAVVTSSNKSEYITIFNVEEGKVSPELVESARVNFGAQKAYDTWIRTDHENYSYVTNLLWTDHDTLKFEASLAYQNTEIIENVNAVYHFGTHELEVIERN